MNALGRAPGGCPVPGAPALVAEPPVADADSPDGAAGIVGADCDPAGSNSPDCVAPAPMPMMLAPPEAMMLAPPEGPALAPESMLPPVMPPMARMGACGVGSLSGMMPSAPTDRSSRPPVTIACAKGLDAEGATPG